MQAHFQGDLDQVGAKIRSSGKAGFARFEGDDRWPNGRFAAEGYDENRVGSWILIAPIEGDDHDPVSLRWISGARNPNFPS
jgi:hypothetical protein